jgi:uncharacterized membrane protein
MRRSLFCLVLSLVMVGMCFHVGVNPNVSWGASQPSKLKIYVGPPKVLADNNVYEAVFVQLQDSKGVPARAAEDVVIHLSSSLTHIGSVDSVITVPSGATFAVAKFYSTFTPGTTTITATASGFATVQESITTVGPVPSKLELYSFPPTLPADFRGYKAIVVQLQDSSGSPAKAPIGDVIVTLSCSNITVGVVESPVIIGAGKTYAVAMFFTSTFPGSAVVTAIASGYSSGQVQVTTQSVGGPPTKLKVYVGPPKVPADGVVYEQIAVQLQDSLGRVARAERDITVSLASSDIGVGTVDPSIMIGNGATYAISNFSSTFRSGSTVVTAVATDYTSSKESVTTVGPIPSKLAVYCFSSLPADGGSYNAVVVQLQDAGGTPAKDSVGDVDIDLFSSTPEVGNVSSTVVIAFGKTYAVASFFSKYAAGSTSITAITPGYDSGQGTMTTYLIDLYMLDVSVTADPDNVTSGEQATIRVYVTYSGLGPAFGVTVQLTSSRGGSFSSVTDERNGYYVSMFEAPAVTGQTVIAVSANASKTGYLSGQESGQITVNPLVPKGSIHVYVKDTGGSPVAEASVSSTSQPAGISSLSGTADQQGLVVFEDVLTGSYTFRAEKPDYETNSTEVVVLAGQTIDATIYVAGTPLGFLGLPLLMWIIIIVVAVILVVAAVIIARRGRRKPSESEEESTEEKPSSEESSAEETSTGESSARDSSTGESSKED